MNRTNPRRQPMTPAAFRAALEVIGVDAKGLARMIGGADERNIRRAMEDGGEGPSPTLAALARVMAAQAIPGREQGADALRFAVARRVAHIVETATAAGWPKGDIADALESEAAKWRATK